MRMNNIKGYTAEEVAASAKQDIEEDYSFCKHKLLMIL